MLKHLSLTLCLSLFFYSVSAQQYEVIENNSDQQQQTEQTASPQTKQKPVYERSWSFGGNIGLSFWNSGTDILIAPKAYYHISPMFMTGFGLTYIYSSYDDSVSDYSQNSFGGSVMGAIRPIPFLQFSAEYEGLYTSGNSTIKGVNEDYNNDYSFWNNAIYLGASFVSRNVSFGMRYDVLYDASRSVYGSAWSPVIGFYF